MFKVSNIKEYFYPFKNYIFGGVFYLSIYIYGINLLKDVFIKNFLLFLIYTFVSGFFFLFYYGHFKFYKDNFKFKLNLIDKSIDIKVFEKESFLNYDDILAIVISDHKIYTRYHKVLHIFDIHGNDFYITDDISNFSSLMNYLIHIFEWKVHIVQENSIVGVVNCKEEFMKNLSYNDYVEVNSIINKSLKK